MSEGANFNQSDRAMRRASSERTSKMLSTQSNIRNIWSLRPLLDVDEFVSRVAVPAAMNSIQKCIVILVDMALIGVDILYAICTSCLYALRFLLSSISTIPLLSSLLHQTDALLLSCLIVLTKTFTSVIQSAEAIVNIEVEHPTPLEKHAPQVVNATNTTAAAIKKSTIPHQKNAVSMNTTTNRSKSKNQKHNNTRTNMSIMTTRRLWMLTSFREMNMAFTNELENMERRMNCQCTQGEIDLQVNAERMDRTSKGSNSIDILSRLIQWCVAAGNRFSPFFKFATIPAATTMPVVKARPVQKKTNNNTISVSTFKQQASGQTSQPTALKFDTNGSHSGRPLCGDDEPTPSRVIQAISQASLHLPMQSVMYPDTWIATTDPNPNHSDAVICPKGKPEGQLTSAQKQNEKELHHHKNNQHSFSNTKPEISYHSSNALYPSTNGNGVEYKAFLAPSPTQPKSYITIRPSSTTISSCLSTTCTSPAKEVHKSDYDAIDNLPLD